VLDNPRYIVAATGQDSNLLLGAFFEVVLIIAIIGTAATLFPIVRAPQPAHRSRRTVLSRWDRRSRAAR